MFTHWWILLVQFLLLREEVQTLPQRDLAARASLGDGQRQITEHIECVGIVGAHWAVQRAPQLAREQVCERRVARIISGCTDQTDGSPRLDLLSLPTILLSSLSKCFFHMAAASSEILGEDKRWENIRSHIKVVKAWILNLFHTNTHTPKSGELLFSLLPCSSHIGFAVDFRVQLVQKEPEELLCVLLTGSNTETRKAFLFMSVLQEAISIQVSIEIVHVLRRLILSCAE